MNTIIEPFRIKTVEPIRMTSVAERENILCDAGYNLFSIASRDVLIDLLTDSGTGAMSTKQWASIMQGDESYAGSPSFKRFEVAIQNLFPFAHIIPTHQGRAAEAILFSIMGGAGRHIPSNTHFDTTRGNVEATGAEAHDLVIEEGKDPQNQHPFKGNMDVNRLDEFLLKYKGKVPCVMLTVTNNAGGGQPVSLENIRATRAIAKKHGLPFIIDACRFAENAWFIKLREPGQQDRSITDIVRDMFEGADGMTMSAKKDAFANIGGWLALNDSELAEKARTRLILTEGFPTYGGLAGRDLEAIAQGLTEIVDEDYLRYRVAVNEYIGKRLEDMSVPIVKPVGGHAVFIDARAFLPHIEPLHYPGQSLACEMYRVSGVRACEIGTVMFGRKPDGSEHPAAMDLVRLAIPRRTYTQSHADYMLERIADIARNKDKLRGMRITWEPPAMRHFTAKFEMMAD